MEEEGDEAQEKIGQFDGADDGANSSDESDVENYKGDDGINIIKDEYSVRLLLTNARSLKPKIDLLKSAFSSLGLNLACITETWYKGGRDLKEHIRDVEGASGIRILHKSRDGRTKGVGGGVAVAFDTASCNLKMRTLKHMPNKFEVMSVAGVIGKVKIKVVVFVVYVQPTLKAAELEELREALSVEVGATRSTYSDPFVLVTGDFNHRDVGNALNEVGEFTTINTGPTRGNNTIDVIYTNDSDAHRDVRVLPPLESTSGVPSDHRCVYTEAKFPPQKNYKWVTQWRRTRDEAREAAFAEDMRGWDWEPLAAATDVDVMTTMLEETFDTLTNKHFPLVCVRKRSNESPWITRKIRRTWRRKIRLYRKAGRSRAWWETERKIQAKITEARAGFVERLLEDGNNGKSFYAATKKLSKAAASPQWTVSDLFPGLEPMR